MSRIALCAIGRLENRYALEFVEYYRSIGFDHVYIYDNNYKGEEVFEDSLGGPIRDGYVTVIDIRDKKNVQMDAYNDCYQTYGKDYDWIAFFDFDEFLVINDGCDIHRFMQSYDRFECLLVNWMDYTDGNMLTDDGRPMIERFTVPMPYDRKVTYDFPENDHVKSIVKGGLRCRFEENPHVPALPMKCCTTNGEQCTQVFHQPYDHSIAYLKHFTTKTAEEWVHKWKRGSIGRPYEKFKEHYKEYFFKINDRTKEKEDYLRRWLT